MVVAGVYSRIGLRCLMDRVRHADKAREFELLELKGAVKMARAGAV